MLKGQALDFGHSTDAAIEPDAIADRFEHTSCNRRAGAILGQDIQDLRPSRDW